MERGVTRTKDCEKLARHTNEWNVIYPFIEWLREKKKVSLCRYQTEEEAKAAGYVFEIPFRISESIEDLLYEYFDVDPVKVEKERREILADLQKRQG